MKLIGFRVTNFRSVEDSGWIETERVTALIGVNESGKTNLLLPLWKLNPARDGEIKPTSDYPKANYAAIRANPASFIFIKAEFEIAELTKKIADVSGADSEVLRVVEISKTFDGQLHITFPKHIPLREYQSDKISGLIQSTLQELEAINPLAKETTFKPELLNTLNLTLKRVKESNSISAESLSGFCLTLQNILPENPAPTSSLIPPFKRLLESLKHLEAKLKLPSPSDLPEIIELIEEQLPKFVFYSNYGNLDSEIYLPHVVDNMKRENLGAREAAKARTLRVLFSFVRLQPEEILELGRDFPHLQGRTPLDTEIAEIATKKRERTILLNSAGTELTKQFRNWWKQGDYFFDFQADGDHFRIWISDARRPEKVELEDRSTGLQWFLSFYLVFLVESREDHKNAILLLDEPGLSLHPLAQKDLSAFFEGLSETNQIIYTTHSPFLIDADMLDRARKVFVSDNGSTKASADLRRGSDDPRKSGATYAIYSALNMTVAESMLFGCQPIIVEGPSDQHYLAAIKMVLINKNLISPKLEIVFPPAHGARNAKVVASILTGRDDILPIMLLDGDDAGKKMAKDMQNGLYQEAKHRILLTNNYLDFDSSEIEDLFPQDFFADAIDRWQRGAETTFKEVVVPRMPIVPQIEIWADKQQILLQEGWKVDLARQVKNVRLAIEITGGSNKKH